MSTTDVVAHGPDVSKPDRWRRASSTRLTIEIDLCHALADGHGYMMPAFGQLSAADGLHMLAVLYRQHDVSPLVQEEYGLARVVGSEVKEAAVLGQAAWVIHPCSDGGLCQT